MLCYAVLCYALLCYAILYYAMLCYAMLCCAMLCCAMLCYAMSAMLWLCVVGLAIRCVFNAMLYYAMLYYAVLFYFMILFCGEFIFYLFIYLSLFVPRLILVWRGCTVMARRAGWWLRPMRCWRTWWVWRHCRDSLPLICGEYIYNLSIYLFPKDWKKELI